MFLALDSHDQEIADAAADFLGQEFPLQRLHAAPRDPENLEPFAELGWLGLSAPEAAGGSGLGAVEEMLFFFEHGRVAGPLEVLVQMLAVAVAGTDADVAGPLVAAETSAALLVQESAGGELRMLGNPAADFALAVRPDASVLYALEGSDFQQVPCLDRSVGMYLGDAGCLEQMLVAGGGDTWLRAQVDISAMLVGLADTALRMIVDYAKQRETFGRAIGAYQAVRHPCADMAVRVEAARCQLFYAATALREGHADAAMQCDAARLLAERAAKQNTDTNIQLHGGIGVTDEHDAHLLLKRANLLSRLFRSGGKQRARLLDTAGEG